MQSRAFLSQLSVTGDESGFFYFYTLRTNLIDFFFFPILFCKYSLDYGRDFNLSSFECEIILDGLKAQKIKA